jgi:hypothetical protein
MDNKLTSPCMPDPVYQTLQLSTLPHNSSASPAEAENSRDFPLFSLPELLNQNQLIGGR